MKFVMTNRYLCVGKLYLAFSIALIRRCDTSRSIHQLLVCCRDCCTTIARWDIKSIWLATPFAGISFPQTVNDYESYQYQPRHRRRYVRNDLLIRGIGGARANAIERPRVQRGTPLNRINCPLLCKRCSSFRILPRGIPAYFHSFTRADSFMRAERGEGEEISLSLSLFRRLHPPFLSNPLAPSLSLFTFA